jgi:hypothetical protein
MNHYQQQYLDDISEPEGYEPSQDDINTCVDALLSNKELHFSGLVLEISDVAEKIAQDEEFVYNNILLNLQGHKKQAEWLLNVKIIKIATELSRKYLKLKQMMPEIRSIEL